MGNKIDLLYEKKDRIAAGGGEKRIAKQHDSGKLTARERLNYLAIILFKAINRK